MKINRINRRKFFCTGLAAASYGRGVSELNIGMVMRTRRSELWVSTKIHDRTYDRSMRLLEHKSDGFRFPLCGAGQWDF